MVIPAVVAAVLWLASGWTDVVTASDVYAGRALRLFVPSPTKAQFWVWPAPWSILTLLLASASVGALVALVLALLLRSRSGLTFVGVWFATVAVGAIVGLVIDGVGVLDSVAVVGWRAIASTTVEYAVVGAYWGLVQGWIPALIASRRGATDATVQPAPRRVLPWSLGAAGLVLVLFVVAGVAGKHADREAIAREAAAAQGFAPEDGAAPDPAAPGSPPPAVALTTVERAPSWCTPDQAMPLLGSQDAATGHRVLSIRMMNFSTEPCVVEGYPDIAFADQNGNELDVAIMHDSSFMAQDAGAQPVEIAPGGYAIAFLGWDANSTHGALVARSLFAAQVPGDERGSWPVELDIVEGSQVDVTAWALDELGPADGMG